LRRNDCALWNGMGALFQAESLRTFEWNECALSSGICRHLDQQITDLSKRVRQCIDEVLKHETYTVIKYNRQSLRLYRDSLDIALQQFRDEVCRLCEPIIRDYLEHEVASSVMCDLLVSQILKHILDDLYSFRSNRLDTWAMTYAFSHVFTWELEKETASLHGDQSRMFDRFKTFIDGRIHIKSAIRGHLKGYGQSRVGQDIEETVQDLYGKVLVGIRKPFEIATATRPFTVIPWPATINLIVRSRVIDWLRHVKNQPQTVSLDVDIDDEGTNGSFDYPEILVKETDMVFESAEAASFRRILIEDVKKALSELPVRDRTLVELKLRGYTNKEIAEAFGIPIGTVGPKYGRILRKLRPKLVAYAPIVVATACLLLLASANLLWIAPALPVPLFCLTSFSMTYMSGDSAVEGGLLR